MKARRRTSGSARPGDLLGAEKEAGFSPSMSKRLRDAAARAMADPSWGSELGRLLAEGALTHAEHRAGSRFEELHRKYHRSLGGPHDATARPLDAERGGEPPDPTSEAGKRLAGREKAARSDYEMAAAVIGRFAGERGVDLVVGLCVGRGVRPARDDLARCRRALAGLAAFWRIG